jgi:hypothetical protein
LPPSWRTLYALTKLPPETLEAKIIDGTITPFQAIDPDQRQGDTLSVTTTEIVAAISIPLTIAVACICSDK